jgi:hypothetical protein
MNITTREIELAMAALAKARHTTPLAAIPPGMRTPEEQELAKKYPRHTLAEAREIEGTPRPSWEGYSSGFEKIVYQERNGNHPLSGDHT